MKALDTSAEPPFGVDVPASAILNPGMQSWVICARSCSYDRLLIQRMPAAGHGTFAAWVINKAVRSSQLGMGLARFCARVKPW